MKVSLYHCNSVPNKLNKDLSLKITLDNIVVKGDFLDTSTPSITLYNVNMEGVDYVYIEDFDTYYFIIGVEYLKNNLIKITVKKDLLMTYKNEILDSTGIVIETDTLDTGIYNGDIPVSEEKETRILQFNNGKDKFTDDFLYLTVAN